MSGHHTDTARKAKQVPPKAVPLMTETAMALPPSHYSPEPAAGTKRRAVLDWVRKHPGQTAGQIAEGLVQPISPVSGACVQLEDAGWLTSYEAIGGPRGIKVKHYRAGHGIAPEFRPLKVTRAVHREPQAAPGVTINDRATAPPAERSRPAAHEPAGTGDVEEIEAAPAPVSAGPEDTWDRRQSNSRAGADAPAGDQPVSAPRNMPAKTAGSAASVSGPVPVAPSAPQAEGRAPQPDSAPPTSGAEDGRVSDDLVLQYERMCSDGDHVRFALYDDCELNIEVGDEVIRLPRKAVQRLHRFLNGFLEIVS